MKHRVAAVSSGTDRLKFTQRETKSESYLLPVKENPVEDYEEKVEDIPHETEEETLSLERNV